MVDQGVEAMAVVSWVEEVVLVAYHLVYPGDTKEEGVMEEYWVQVKAAAVVVVGGMVD